MTHHWGDYYTRVARDVLNGYISPEAARSQYKVAVDALGLVDEKETASMRGARV